jgi:hypothetical protein
MVITGVADRAPERIGQLIYSDAPVPRDGESALDNGDQAGRAVLEAAVRERGDGWLVPGPRMPEAERGGGAFSRLTPQPFATLTQPLRLTNMAAASRLPKTYVLCTETAYIEWRRSYLVGRIEGPEWRVEEIAADHHPHVSMPERVAELLLDLPRAREAAARTDEG